MLDTPTGRHRPEMFRAGAAWSMRTPAWAGAYDGTWVPAVARRPVGGGERGPGLGAPVTTPPAGRHRSEARDTRSGNGGGVGGDVLGVTLPQPQVPDDTARWPAAGPGPARVPVQPGGPYYGPPVPAQWHGAPVSPVYPQAPQVTVNVAAGGGPGRSVTKTRKSTSHGLHLFLTIITGGAWGLFVWLPLVLWHKLGPRTKTVTRHR